MMNLNTVIAIKKMRGSQRTRRATGNDKKFSFWEMFTVDTLGKISQRYALIGQSKVQ